MLHLILEFKQYPFFNAHYWPLATLRELDLRPLDECSLSTVTSTDRRNTLPLTVKRWSVGYGINSRRLLMSGLSNSSIS